MRLLVALLTRLGGGRSPAYQPRGEDQVHPQGARHALRYRPPTSERCTLQNVAAAGITVVKSFTYRGAPEEWSNTYHFQGSAPSTPADWRALVDDFLLLEKQCLWVVNTILRVICYADTDDSSVYSYDLSAYGGTIPGVYDPPTSEAIGQEGDTVYEVRWGTGRLTSKSKPIYLRKYFHPGLSEPGSRDAISADLKAVCDTFASAVMTDSGDWPGLAGPDGVAPTGYRTMPFISTRQLRKGRRRPT